MEFDVELMNTRPHHHHSYDTCMHTYIHVYGRRELNFVDKCTCLSIHISRRDGC